MHTFHHYCSRAWPEGVNSETLGMRSTTSQTLGTTWSARPTSSLRGSSLYCDEPAAMMMAYGDGGSTTSCSWMPSSPIAGLEDLPDGVIARALWTGFLDSLEVASALRTVSRRFQAIGSNACQVCSAFAGGPCDSPKSHRYHAPII